MVLSTWVRLLHTHGLVHAVGAQQCQHRALCALPACMARKGTVGWSCLPSHAGWESCRPGRATQLAAVGSSAAACGLPPPLTEVLQARINNAFLIGFNSSFKVVSALGLDFSPL